MTTVGELVDALLNTALDINTPVVTWHHGMSGETITATLDDGKVVLTDDGDC